MMEKPPFPKPYRPYLPFPKPYNPFRYLTKRRDLTYIFGARCRNGVVLVGDRKVTIGNTGQFELAPKISSPYGSVVWGAAGWKEFFDSFENRVNVEIGNVGFRQAREGQVQGVRIGEFRIIIEEVYEHLARLYGDRLRYGGLSVLVGQRAYAKAELWLIEQYGAPQVQNGYMGIGSGAPHGELFVKRFYEPRRSTVLIREAAEIGYFIVKYIEKFEVESTVGVGKDFPQVWFLYDNPPEGEKEGGDYPIRPATQQELDEMEANTQTRLRKLETNLNDLWTVNK